MSLRLHNITTDDMANGEGLRVVVWISGCEHHCKNCHNPETWDKNSGVSFCERDWETIIKELGKDYISGVTFSGGDPLHTENREEVADIMKSIKNLFPNKTIWCYTGYTFNEVKNIEAMKYIDVLVDGKFSEGLKMKELKFRGSANQRIIDVQRSLKEKEVILYME